MRSPLNFLCVLISGILPLVAQTDDGGDGRKNAGRTAWFACLSKPKGLENPVKVLAGDKLTPLDLPEFMASEGVEIPKDGILRIVRETPDPADKEKIKYVVLAEAMVPEGVREALIILGPLAKPEGDLLFRTKVQDLASFKGGDRFFINMSDTNIRVRLGITTVAVAAKQANIYSAPPMEKPTNMPIIYEFYHPERKEWLDFSASTVVLRPTRREICVFNDGSRLGSIKKHKILFPVQARNP